MIQAACSFAILLAAVSAASAEAHEAGIPSAPAVARTSPAPWQIKAVAVAEAFSQAIAAGDEAGLRVLLLPEVLIFESGGAEASAAEYAGHHLPADIAFMAQMKRSLLSQVAGGDGTTAWVATRSSLEGHYGGKAVDLDSTETLILTRTASGWRIAHVHWSSAPHRAAH